MTIRRWMKIVPVIAWLCAVVAGGPHLGIGIFMATLCTWIGFYSVRYPAFAIIVVPLGVALGIDATDQLLRFLFFGSIVASLVGATVGTIRHRFRRRFDSTHCVDGPPSTPTEQATVGNPPSAPVRPASPLATPAAWYPFLAPAARNLAALLAFLGLLTAYLNFTGIAERLNDPILVQGWSSEGLIAGKRIIPLPGIGPLPSTSTALAKAIENGVEVATDGRVYGLVRVHHWCGNDPVRYHLARVDLAFLLIYLRDAQPLGGLDPKLRSKLAARPGGRFSKFGWWLDEYSGFRWWCRDAEKLARSHPVAIVGPATGAGPSQAAGPTASGPTEAVR